MDMILPAADLGGLSINSGLIIALVLGIGFGILLEQGGMGSAKKIAGQFYLRDLSVLKIMFSAIITAALGLYWLARIGYLDYSLVFVEPTFIWPQIVGGLLFGLGFVTGGLCPGTSCVAVSSGRIDGMVLLFGMLAGIVVFNESYPWFESFYRSGALGPATLPEIFNISHSILLVLLVALAIGVFAVAEKLEIKFKTGAK